MGLFGKLFGKKEKESLDQGLEKTKEGFLGKIANTLFIRYKIKSSLNNFLSNEPI